MADQVSTPRRDVLLAGLATLGVVAAGGAAAAQSAKKVDKMKKLKDAIAAMNAAKAEIMGGGGFGGHKKKSIDALTAAVTELEAAIKYAEEKQ